METWVAQNIDLKQGFELVYLLKDSRNVLFRFS